MKVNFGSVEVRLTSEAQAKKVSEAAYRTREVNTKRYGAEVPVLNVTIHGDIATFSSTEKSSGHNMPESLLMKFLRQQNIPFKNN